MQIPPIFGIDSVHGASYIKDAVMYPHALHAAASWDPRHTYLAMRSAARHTRAGGIHWVFCAFFSSPHYMLQTSGFCPRAECGCLSFKAFVRSMHTCGWRVLRCPCAPARICISALRAAATIHNMQSVLCAMKQSSSSRVPAVQRPCWTSWWRRASPGSTRAPVRTPV